MFRQVFKIFYYIPAFFICIILIFSLCACSENEETDGGIYTISTAEDLVAFAKSVNGGKDYSGQTVNQTCDINLDGIEFIPIGLFDSGNYFYGTYNGNGYAINNLYIVYSENGYNNGLFGQLGGTVMNVNVNGYIFGNCCGSICSHSASYGAKIINCHSSVVFSANRCGGIADNFNGYIIGCSYFSEEQTNYVVSYNAISVKYSCTNSEEIFPETFVGETKNNYAVTSIEELKDCVNGNLTGTAAASGTGLGSLTKFGATETGGFFDSLTHYPSNTLKQYFYHIAAVIGIIVSVFIIALTLIFQIKKSRGKANENQ